MTIHLFSPATHEQDLAADNRLIITGHVMAAAATFTELRATAGAIAYQMDLNHFTASFSSAS
jgi:hypothetical protein